MLPSAEIPQLAICLNTTARDYAYFLQSTLDHSVLPKALVDESEKDYTPFMSKLGLFTIYGDYAFGHFKECYDSYEGFTAECAEANVHADPGAFGFYPLIDRKRGYVVDIYSFTADILRILLTYIDLLLPSSIFLLF